ncbi:MAG: Rhizobium phage RHEph10 [Pseudomonadota bacterium]|jgi:hypothetical protein
MQIEDKLLYHSQVLADLHSAFMPHRGQINVGHALFTAGKKRIFVECGRKWGKTEMLIYSLYRTCLMNQNQWCYYIAPFKDQIKDLVWSNGRLPYFLTKKLMDKYGITINNSDFRVSFRNGSFIKSDGADNYEKGRGYSATGLVVYDEFKDHNPNFHDGFEPNLGITDAPLMIIGTPPDASEDSFKRWCTIADEVLVSPVGFHICMPSMTNPHISKDFFIRKEAELREKGEYWKWQKEYLAMRVRASGNNIFPMLSPQKHVKSYKEMMDTIGCFPKQWDFFGGFDPGSAKCFAFLAVAINRYNKQVFVLDQIYATKLEECRVDNILPRAIKIMRDIMPHQDSWLCVYDYAATWFMNEAQSPAYIDDIVLLPCTKDLKNKENKLSLIKDILIKEQSFFMSERCVKDGAGLFWEMEKYATDDKGKIPKEDDHAIDTFRYILNAANFHSVEMDEPISEQELFPERRGFRLHNDYSMSEGESIYGDIDRDLFGADDHGTFF